ncbi:uncharacterized protein LOC110367413 isoform X2 [Fundulus heteroclitus]|uniref:uncharacterized protein LOC110367413 isoform X2 n=1 Tax=Fundulus heteroclitus TaxID=8078 RepID=UPI00165C2BA3|nr:uncharacterized protein LOC110367413 isoform X2 [Fundulus heteroclitus]
MREKRTTMAEDNTESSQWRESEVADLIHIWRDSSNQAKLEGSYRKRGIFENIFREMAERAYKHSWIQCQRKIKSLWAKYKEAKDINKRSGHGRVTCPFYEELDSVLGDKPRVQPPYLVDSCFAEEKTEERSPGPAANRGSSDSGDTSDGMLASPSTPASTSEESSTSRTDDTSFNSSTPSTSTVRSANKRKRKSKLETTLDVFVDKIGRALKNEETDLLLKMQAAQHDHERKMFSTLSQFLERSSHPPQPPFYHTPMEPSQPYSPRAPPTHSSSFPVVSGPSNIRPLSFLQDLHQLLVFNSAHPHSHVT